MMTFSLFYNLLPRQNNVFNFFKGEGEYRSHNLKSLRNWVKRAKRLVEVRCSWKSGIDDNYFYKWVMWDMNSQRIKCRLLQFVIASAQYGRGQTFDMTDDRKSLHKWTLRKLGRWATRFEMIFYKFSFSKNRKATMVERFNLPNLLCLRTEWWVRILPRNTGLFGKRLNRTPFEGWLYES